MRPSLKRSAILKSAEELFGEVGFENARVEDIVDRAGTSIATFYKHFARKEEILDGLLSARVSRVVASALEAMARESGLEERLLAFVDAGCAALFSDEVLTSLFANGVALGRRDHMGAFFDRAEEIALRTATQALETARQRGQLDIDDPEAVTVIVVSAIVGWCSRAQKRRRISPERFRAGLSKLLRAGFSGAKPGVSTEK